MDKCNQKACKDFTEQEDNNCKAYKKVCYCFRWRICRFDKE